MSSSLPPSSSFGWDQEAQRQRGARQARPRSCSCPPSLPPSMAPTQDSVRDAQCVYTISLWSVASNITSVFNCLSSAPTHMCTLLFLLRSSGSLTLFGCLRLSFSSPFNFYPLHVISGENRHHGANDKLENA